MKFILFIFIFLTMSKSFAHIPEEGRVTAVFGPLIYKTDITHSNPSVNIPFRGGAGLVVEGDLDKNGGIEIAMFYINKMYSLRQGLQEDIEDIQRMYVTTGYRYWFSSQTSLAIAYFSSYSMGDAESIFDSTPASKTIATSAGKITESGIDFSLQWEIWSRGRSALVLDGRYSLSLSEKENEDANMYGMLLGFKYDVQGEPKAAPAQN